MAKVKVDVVWSKELRKETSRLASIANKRIERLERNNLRSSPAYQKWVEDGEVRFSVRGKTINEVQAEMARLRKFLDSKTSTIRGINNTLKEMAENTGMKYKNVAELRAKADNFFTLASKVEQYLRTVEDIASAIGYQKIWEAINQYVEAADMDLSSSTVDLDRLTEIVTNALTEKDSGRADEMPYQGGTIWTVVK